MVENSEFVDDGLFCQELHRDFDIFAIKR